VYRIFGCLISIEIGQKNPLSLLQTRLYKMYADVIALWRNSCKLE